LDELTTSKGHEPKDTIASRPSKLVLRKHLTNPIFNPIFDQQSTVLYRQMFYWY